MVKLKPKIIICAEHPEYEVPLLYTIAFGMDHWCPYCGKVYDTHDRTVQIGKEIGNSPELNKRHDDYLKFSQPYMEAYNRINSKLKYTLLPKKKTEFEQIIENWKYGTKIEDLLSETKH